MALMEPPRPVHAFVALMAAPKTPRPRRRSGDDLDDEIRHVESAVAGIATAEILWGGPRGDGLVHTVTRLSTTVENLAATVATLGGRVMGSEGIEVKLAALVVTVDAVKAAVDQTKSDMDEKFSFALGVSKWFGGILSTLVVAGLAWFIAHGVANGFPGIGGR